MSSLFFPGAAFCAPYPANAIAFFRSSPGGSRGSRPGLLIAFLLALGYEYFILGLDYRGTENVQFEDDDYYYYVTAVPKIRIVEEEKEVKKI